jgi:hypothetical protein
LYVADENRQQMLLAFLDKSSIQMEWLHSANEGSLQISEDTIYVFVPLQMTSLLSAQKWVSSARCDEREWKDP